MEQPLTGLVAKDHHPILVRLILPLFYIDIYYIYHILYNIIAIYVVVVAVHYLVLWISSYKLYLWYIAYGVRCRCMIQRIFKTANCRM